MRRVCADQIDSFNLNGFLAVDDVVSAAEIAALDEHVKRIVSGGAAHIPADRIQLEKPFREGKVQVVDQMLSVRKLSAITVRDGVF